MPEINTRSANKPTQGKKKINFMPIAIAGAAVIVVVLALVMIFSNGNKNQPVDLAPATDTPSPEDTPVFSTHTPNPDVTATPDATPVNSESGDGFGDVPLPSGPTPTPKPVPTVSMKPEDQYDAFQEADARYALVDEMVKYSNMQFNFPWDKGFTILDVRPMYHTVNAEGPSMYVYVIGDTNKKAQLEVYLDARKKGPRIWWNESGTPYYNAIKKMESTPPSAEFEDDHLYFGHAKGLLRKIKGKDEWYNLLDSKTTAISSVELTTYMNKQNVWSGVPLETSVSTYVKSLRALYGTKLPDVITEKMMFEEWGAG